MVAKADDDREDLAVLLRGREAELLRGSAGGFSERVVGRVHHRHLEHLTLCADDQPQLDVALRHAGVGRVDERRRVHQHRGLQHARVGRLRHQELKQERGQHGRPL